MTAPRSRPQRLDLRSGLAPVEVNSLAFRALNELEPQALAVTYWFEAAVDGPRYCVAVQLRGRLRGHAAPGQSDVFTVMATVQDIVAGSGRIAVTTRVPDLSYGTWDVTATPVQPAQQGSARGWVSVDDPRLPSGVTFGSTTFGPVANVLGRVSQVEGV